MRPLATGASASSIRSPAIFVGRAEELARIQKASELIHLFVVYGVAGVGKTSLIRRAAEDIAARHGGRIAYVACRRGDSAAGIAAEVVRQIIGNVTASGDAVADLLAARSTPFVLCLDDVHVATDPAVLELAVHLASLRRGIWVLVGSREALPVSPAVVDHVVVLLDGLEAEHAQTLWDRLTELYGKSTALIEDVIRSGRVTPLLLKRAFGGPTMPSDADPLGLEALTSSEKELLSQACAFRGPAPLAALPDTEGAVDPLLRRFLVERTAEDSISVHDLVRDAVSRSPLAPTKRHHQRVLSFYRERRAGVQDELEMLHHAVLAGERGLAIDILTDHASRVVRIPPGGATMEHLLGEAIDALGPLATLPAPVRALRAQVRARQGQPAQAFEDLRPLVEAVPSAAVDYGAVAVALGHPDEAIAVLGHLIGDENADLLRRILGLGILIGAWAQKGDIPRARREFEAGGALLDRAGPLGGGIRAWIEGMLAFECERYADASAALARARATLRCAPFSVSLPLLGSVERPVAAALGRPVDESIGPGDLFDETPYFRYRARVLRAQELLLRGDATGAATLAEATLAAARTNGYRALAHEATLVLAEAELILGRLDSARGRLEGATESAATEAPRVYPRLEAIRARALLLQGQSDRAYLVAREASRAVSFAPGTSARLDGVRLLARAGRIKRPASQATEGFDGTEWLLASAESLLAHGRLDAAARLALTAETTSRAAGWGFLSCRARVLLAEAALRRGDLQGAQSALEVAQKDAASRGYAAETAACNVLEAALTRLHGGEVGLREGPLAHRLGLDEAANVALRTNTGKYLLAPRQLEQWDLSSYDLVLDFVRRRAKVGPRKLDLMRRGLLLDLSRALARTPAFVSQEEVARSLWGVQYHALRHHSRLTMAVSRLRQLLGAGFVEGTTEGYRLVLPNTWAIIESATDS